MTTLYVGNESFEGVSLEEYIESKFSNYKPRIEIEIKTENYLLYTAASKAELIELFQLRYDIFFRENKSNDKTGVDLDEFDPIYDHIIIKSNKTSKICGTYRLLASNISQKGYSDTVFNLSEFYKTPRIKLELGRACTHPDHRNGILMNLLWRGIAEYSSKINADILFGCCTVMTTSAQVLYGSLKMLEKKEVHSRDYNISPKEHYKFNYPETIIEEENEKMILKSLPHLLREYILAGAKIYGLPAVDEDRNCAYFFTVLFFNKMNLSFKKHYFER